MKLADEDPSVVFAFAAVVEARHLPTNVTLVVKLLGEAPTAYYWKVTTPEVDEVPQVLFKVELTPKAVKERDWQQVPAPVQPVTAVQAVPALAVTAVVLAQAHV